MKSQAKPAFFKYPSSQFIFPCSQKDDTPIGNGKNPGAATNSGAILGISKTFLNMVVSYLFPKV